MKTILRTGLLIGLLSLFAAGTASAEEFTYKPPGELESGTAGVTDDTVYVPGMRYPIENAPSYPNSQVYGHGGYKGPGGGQCDPDNYSYPWWDNYCEPRSWDMPLCPGGTGHQGQDIRPATCEDNVHWAVAAESGQISNIGSYSVWLISDDGTQHRYLHMEPSSVRVSEGQNVERGERLGRVSNAFNGTPTTIHLHYDINQYVGSVGKKVYVPTYMSLVRSYEELIGQPAEPCEVLPGDGGILDDYGPCFTQYGSPQYWREVEGQGHDGKLHWTNAWDNDTPGNWARWYVHLAEAGEYNVEVNVVSEYGKSRKVRYMVRHAGEETTVEIDQSAVDGWASLGQFEFAEGGDQQVEVYDNTGETADDLHITADAVRLTRIDGNPNQGDADMSLTDPPEMDMGSGGEEGDGGGNSGMPDAGSSSTTADMGPENGVDSVSSSSGCCAVVGGDGEDAGAAGLLALLAGLFLHRRRRTRRR